MLVLPVLLLLVVGVAVVATSTSERPPLLSLLGLGAAGLVVVLVATAVVGVGLRGGGDEEEDATTTPTATAPAEPSPVEVRDVDTVIRPGGRSDALDRLPEVSTRLVRIPTDDPLLARQCVDGGGCLPGVPVLSNDGSAVGLVELRRRIDGTDCSVVRCSLVVTRAGSGHRLAEVPLWFGRPAPVVRAAPTVARPARPDVRPDLPGGRVGVGLAAGAVLLALAAWLLRRRPEEEVEDPFWEVGLDVPEWEGVSVELDDDEWLSPAGGPPAPRAR